MRELESRIRSWMFDTALPLWSSDGLDDQCGGYIERFDPISLTPITDVKRVRVVARQIYVFSHAACLGFSKGKACAKHGFDFLVSNGWVSDQFGWARTLSREGAILDATPDLYDQAFVLFALGWYYKMSSDGSALAHAQKTLIAIEDSYRADIGFFHEIPPTGHRQQNPHMHLLEAMLVLFESTQQPQFEKLAKELLGLFQTHFFDGNNKTLAEFYDDDLVPVAGPDGRITEPGHQFEWAWILMKAQTAFDLDLSNEIRSLVEFGEAYGVNPKNGMTYQQVRDDGKPIDTGSRTWPNTERLKAAVAMYELEGKNPMPVFEESSSVLFKFHLAGPKTGTWTEKFDSNGQVVSNDVPASTFYHVFLAFAEVLRILDTLATTKPSTSSAQRV